MDIKAYLYIWLLFILYLLSDNNSNNISINDNKEIFIAECKTKNIKNIDLAYDLIYSNLSDVEIATKYGINVDSVWQQRWRIKKKLNID